MSWWRLAEELAHGAFGTQNGTRRTWQQRIQPANGRTAYCAASVAQQSQRQRAVREVAENPSSLPTNTLAEGLRVHAERAAHIRLCLGSTWPHKAANWSSISGALSCSQASQRCLHHWSERQAGDSFCRASQASVDAACQYTPMPIKTRTWLQRTVSGIIRFPTTRRCAKDQKWPNFAIQRRSRVHLFLTFHFKGRDSCGGFGPSLKQFRANSKIAHIFNL